jgi:hypothetical protein
MTQFDQFAQFAMVSVWANGRMLPLGEALDREPTDLLDPLWGVVAAWDAERGRHIMNWDLGWVLVDAADDDWPRRQLLFELASCEPLDLDLIAAAIERHPDLPDGDLTRQRGGRVRRLDDGRWVAEHGPVHGPMEVDTAASPEEALALLTDSCESSRAQLRAALRDTGDALLARIATAPWWCPRYEIWSTSAIETRRVPMRRKAHSPGPGGVDHSQRTAVRLECDLAHSGAANDAARA